MSLTNIPSKIRAEFESVKKGKNPKITSDIEAVVVLSGESGDPITEDGSFDTQERMRLGVKIYKTIQQIGGKPELIVAGTEHQNQLTLKLAKKNGIEQASIVKGIPPAPYASTLDQFKQLKTDRKHLAIVTHAIHGPRTLRYAIKYLLKNTEFKIFLIGRRSMEKSAIDSELSKIQTYAGKEDIDLFPEKKRIVAIIQARMTSTRLPGKVLAKIREKPMVTYVVNRTKRSKLIDEVLVATSINKADNSIVSFCKEKKIKCFRGSLNNVLERYYEAARKEKADIVVRVTADCPLIDGGLIDQGIKQFKQTEVDYLSNTVKRTFSRGFDFEVFSFKALAKAYKNAKSEYDKEHVTPYIWKNRDNSYKIGYFTQKKDLSGYRITVDTKEDFLVIKQLIV